MSEEEKQRIEKAIFYIEAGLDNLDMQGAWARMKGAIADLKKMIKEEK